MSRREFVRWAVNTTATVGVLPGTLAAVDFLQQNAKARKETVFPSCSLEECQPGHVQAELTVIKKTLANRHAQLDAIVLTALWATAFFSLRMEDKRK